MVSKFRMWNQQAQKYHYEVDKVMECLKQQVFFNEHRQSIMSYNHSQYGDCFEQKVGIKDKNGVDIYEGDIVSSNFSDGSKCIKIVKYIDEKASFQIANVSELQDENLFDIWRSFSKGYIDEFGFEVIGNIHQNLELLE